MGSEAIWRPVIFLGVLGAMLIIEMRMPHHVDPMQKTRRVGNSLLFLSGLVLARLALPAGAIGIAILGEQRGWGVLPQLGANAWLAVVIGVLALDLAIYGQHVVFHKVTWLWRLHRVHHADPAMDVTSGLRFHPFEILLSLGIKAAVILALGISPLAVLIFEILLNAGSMITHANWKMPQGIDRVLRIVLVTPAMHRIHHSVERDETDSNYGFSFSVWDRLFGTYRDQPRAGDNAIVLGIGHFDHEDDQKITPLLTQPFKAP